MPDSPTTHRGLNTVVGRRIDQLPLPPRREPGQVRRGPNRAIVVYDPGFPARPWHVLYSAGEGPQIGTWLAEQDTAAWKDLTEARPAVDFEQVAPNTKVYRAAVNAERRENGRLSAKLGEARAELARAQARIRELEAPFGTAQPLPITSFVPFTDLEEHAPEPRVPIWPPAAVYPVTTRRPDPAGARFADGCRNVEGTWLHGRPHTCPGWMRA